MNFQVGHIYHIYNQGNNRQRIFFDERNYIFFKEKIRGCILPFADILAWCLMPNHFHLMVYVRDKEKESQGFTLSETLTGNMPKTLNDSIGIMLRSYTRAINIQEKRSGSLFRKETKAICLTNNDDISPSWFNTASGAMIQVDDPERQYPQICFNYIHDNPVNDGLTKCAVDWEFSSMREVIHKPADSLMSLMRAEEYGLV